MKKFKVGFLVDSHQVDYYVYDLIKFVENDKLFSRPIILTGYCKQQKRGVQLLETLLDRNLLKQLNKVLVRTLVKFIKSIECTSVSRIFKNFSKTIDLSSSSHGKTILLDGQWSRSNIFLSFAEHDIKRLQKQNFDCLIRCGSGVLTGEILSVAKHGILSFHHGDNQKIRGAPGGFWEVLNRHPTTGFIIQKLTEELDGGPVLIRGNIVTKELWLLNYAQVLEKSNFFFKKLLTFAATTGKLPKSEGPRFHDQPLSRLNSSAPLIRYAFEILIPKIFTKIFRDYVVSQQPNWSVAFSQHGDFKKSLWRYEEIKNPKGRYLADPFVFEYNSENFIFVEDFSHSDQKGRISVIKVTENGYQFLGVALEEPFHLSFPFVFKSGADLFMIPETSANNDVRLYKCKGFPNNWVMETVLMKDVSAADTMLIPKDGKWYLLTNICSSKIHDHQSELHVFWSTTHNSTDWRPIKQGNPVIFHSELARNGGLFARDGNLYRVNQIHGNGHYGKGFGINKITSLNTESFAEQRIGTVDAEFMEGIRSTHHFSANKTIAAVDFCRFKYSLPRRYKGRVN